MRIGSGNLRQTELGSDTLDALAGLSVECKALLKADLALSDCRQRTMESVNKID
jgi:hypothetical protein